MKTFVRLLAFFKPYRSYLFAGTLVAFFAALFNGISFGAMLPIFESLGSRDREFLIQFSAAERDILRQVVRARGAQESILPPIEEKIDRRSAQELLKHVEALLSEEADKTDIGTEEGAKGENGENREQSSESLEEIRLLQLKTLLYWKLRLNASGYDPFQVTLFTCSLILLLYSMKIFFAWICLHLIARTGHLVVRDIREQTYRKLQHLPLTWFYRQKGGELVSRLVNDAEAISPVISSNLRESVINLFYLAIYALILAYLNIELFLITLAAAPLAFPPLLYLMRKIRRAFTKSQELMANLHGHLHETISGMRIIRLSATEEYEMSRFRQINQRLYWRTFKEFFYLRINPNLMEFSAIVLVLSIIILATYYFDFTDFTGSEFLTFAAILASSTTPIIQLSRMYGNLQGALAACERIFYILDQETDAIQPASPLQPRRLKRSIAFKNLHFTYPKTSQEVLHNINLEVPIGTTTALIGESGAGKSTLMELLARFFIPTQGGIFLDFENMLDFTVKDHRSRIGVVTQDIFLFYGSIYSNIAYGSQHHSRKEVEKAARLAYAHDFIREFDEGYDTLIGNRGLKLSGGQRQKIAIARALLRDPEILILDEATSALDSESERLVQSALERLFRNRTIFVIAHRLSTIEKSDSIVVISQGRIIDQGTHDELIRRESLYAHLQKQVTPQERAEPVRQP